MATLIVKHKRLMSKWTQRGGGNTHKQTQFFSRRRSCYGTHLWASLLIVFRRVRLYCRIRSHDVGGSAGANAMPAARCNACRAMQCIGFQNGRRHADEKFWDHDSTTSERQTTLQCKQARHSQDENKIQAQKSCLICPTRFIPNRPYRVLYGHTVSCAKRTSMPYYL